ncbi:MAG: hypothetical protein R6V77_03745 [Candidatus Cloacimonadaceae bacterium]
MKKKIKMRSNPIGGYMPFRKLLTVIVLSMGLAVLNAAPKIPVGYSLKLIKKFKVPELPKIKKHVMENFKVCMAVSDSLIYFADVNDSTNTKSYCYDFKGKKLDGFSLPADTGYQEPLTFENTFYYLPDSNQLAYADLYSKQKMDFYNLEGQLISQKHKVSEMRENYLDIGEFDNTRYFVSITYLHDKDKPFPENYRSTVKLYEEQQNLEMKVLRNIEFQWGKLERGIDWRALQIDNYSTTQMAVSEVQANEYNITLYTSDKIDTIHIHRENLYTAKAPKMPFQFKLGKNFVALGELSVKLKFPLTQEIYDFNGNYKGTLIFKDDKKNELVDIVGDNLIAVNPLKGTISIYEIKVK